MFNDLLSYFAAHEDQIDWAILENVKTLATAPKSKDDGRPTGPSNLQVCCHLLQQMGFFVLAFVLDPSLFGQVTSRHRVFMICIRQRVIEGAGFSQTALQTLACRVMQKLCGQPRVPLDAVLLPEDHPAIQKHLGTLAQAAQAVALEQPGKKQGSSEVEWPSRHSKPVKGAQGQAWWSPSPFRDAQARQRFPGLNELCARKVDILEMAGISSVSYTHLTLPTIYSV